MDNKIGLASGRVYITDDKTGLKTELKFDEMTEITVEPKDMVNSPNHYTNGEFEVIDVIKDWLTIEEFRGYIKGNIIKYVARERLKNGDEDLFKSIFYLNYLMNGVKSDGKPKKE